MAGTFLRLLTLCILSTTLVASGPKSPKTVRALTFLTRDGCVNTAVMRARLDQALRKLGWPRDYEVIDIGGLPPTDSRTGYPTPTLLWKANDIFAMPTPKPPFPEPT